MLNILVLTMAVGSFKHPIRTGIACPTIGTSFSWVGPVTKNKRREYEKRERVQRRKYYEKRGTEGEKRKEIWEERIRRNNITRKRGGGEGEKGRSSQRRGQ